jgi:HPt (histidine-containing phosphotransfer) domain-containing protein
MATAPQHHAHAAFDTLVPLARQAPSGRPIDLAHLARQTMGDRALEQEVLGLFVRQALAARPRLAAANADERRRLAHTLKGSARSVGAFGLADCLEQVEKGDRTALKTLPNLIEQVCNFVAAIGR